MEVYEKFDFNYELIRDFTNKIDSTLKQIDYLKWILKEYKFVESPRKEKIVTQFKDEFESQLDAHGNRVPRTYLQGFDYFNRRIRADLKYIEDKLVREREDHSAKTIILPKYNLKWNDKYSKSDFLELCKALHESEAIKSSQRDLILAFSELVNLKINNPDQHIKSMITGRNNDSRTKFLDKLIESFLQFLDQRDKKKKN
jgi:hypothetical protein